MRNLRNLKLHNLRSLKLPNKWYYDENRIFLIEAILKHKQVVYMRRKMPFTFSNISFRSRDIQVFKICKLAK